MLLLLDPAHVAANDAFVVETYETIALRIAPAERRVPRPFFMKFRLPIAEAPALLRLLARECGGFPPHSGLRHQ